MDPVRFRFRSFHAICQGSACIPSGPVAQQLEGFPGFGQIHFQRSAHLRNRRSGVVGIDKGHSGNASVYGAAGKAVINRCQIDIPGSGQNDLHRLEVVSAPGCACLPNVVESRKPCDSGMDDPARSEWACICSEMEYLRHNLPTKLKDALFAAYVGCKRTTGAVPYKYAYLKSTLDGSHLGRRILFYPELPNYSHAIYKVLHLLGCRITSDHNAKVDLVVNWDYSTFRTADQPLTWLSNRQMVLNLACCDISKENVERHFEQVFGYSSFVDPRIFSGLCVRKSNANAAHDGRVVQCPLEPEAGYVYQVVINNQVDFRTQDIRVPVISGTIPFAYYKYRAPSGRFLSENLEAVVVETERALRDWEIAKILEFAGSIGLDYGELDILRDRDSQRIYIIDANNTPIGPPNHIRKQDFGKALRALTDAFRDGFLL